MTFLLKQGIVSTAGYKIVARKIIKVYLSWAFKVESKPCQTDTACRYNTHYLAVIRRLEPVSGCDDSGTFDVVFKSFPLYLIL